VIGVESGGSGIFAIEGFDSVRGERIHRPPGCGIEFGQTSAQGIRSAIPTPH
jgi:hypothetical protein